MEECKVMKYKKVCPECGGTEIFMKAVDASSGHGPDLLPGIGGIFFDRKYFELFICGNCGYIQFFVPQKFLDHVKESYESATHK
jgi:ribosomal protein S27AE